MGSPSFGMLPGNNAAPPPVYAGNNPTGSMFGGGGGPNNNFPNFPLFGSMSHGVVSPMANMPVFGGSGMQGLSSGINFNGWGNDPGGHLLTELSDAYGKGTGSYLDKIFTNGLFNPHVASSFLNAMQPGINRGEQDLLSSFASEGSRFGSAAALGEGNYLSQANLNEQQTLAGMFMNAQQEQLGLLENVLPTLHGENANRGGFFSDLFSGLGSFFSGGLLGDLFKGFGGKGQASSQSPLMMPNTNSPSMSMTSPSVSPVTSDSSFWDTYSRDQLTGSGGDALLAMG